MKTRLKFKKALIAIVIGILFHFNCLAQPGCQFIDAGPDIDVDTMGGCVTLQATVLATGSTTSYAVTSIPFAPPYSFNSGTQLTDTINNVWYSPISLPFTFCFFGNIYDQVIIGSNGVLSFGPVDTAGVCTDTFNTAVPSPALPVNAIFCPYHPLNSSGSGAIYYAITGSYPCRQFYVNWYHIAPDSCAGMLATSQVIIYEGTSIIEVYVGNSPLCTLADGGRAVIGIQDVWGGFGYTPTNRNTSQWSAANEAWRFTPNGDTNYSISWYDGANLISSHDTVTVCPTSTTMYTAQVVYSWCDGTQATLFDNVNVEAFAGINEVNNINNNTLIYPNPATDNLTIETQQQAAIEISNIEGQLLKTIISNGKKTNIAVSNLPCGVYVVQVKTEQGVAVKKFVKE